MGYHEYKDCIEACMKAAALSNHCAAACLQEDEVKMMAKCIQLDLECAILCETAARLMSIGSPRALELCRLCAQLCRECADECESHDNSHCAECAKACRHCAEECMEMVEVF